MHTYILLAVLCLAPLTDAIAQEQPLPLERGQRVRVTAPSLDVNKHKATFQRMSGDTHVLSSASYSLSAVTRLDVYAGRQSHPWRGAGVGFFGGAAIGATIMAVVTDSDDEFYVLSVLIGAGSGAGFGLLLGAAFGSVVWTDNWEEVPLDRLRVSIAPTRNGFGIGARIAF